MPADPHSTNALTVRNAIKLDRHVAELRHTLTNHMGRTRPHATEHTHDTGPIPYQDDDQRLGGHDNPHPSDSETT